MQGEYPLFYTLKPEGLGVVELSGDRFRVIYDLEEKFAVA
jgi:hypothetical protein